jgi:hypothetical protein
MASTHQQKQQHTVVPVPQQQAGEGGDDIPLSPRTVAAVTKLGIINKVRRHDQQEIMVGGNRRDATVTTTTTTTGTTTTVPYYQRFGIKLSNEVNLPVKQLLLHDNLAAGSRRILQAMVDNAMVHELKFVRHLGGQGNNNGDLLYYGQLQGQRVVVARQAAPPSPPPAAVQQVDLCYHFSISCADSAVADYFFTLLRRHTMLQVQVLQNDDILTTKK